MQGIMITKRAARNIKYNLKVDGKRSYYGNLRQLHIDTTRISTIGPLE